MSKGHDLGPVINDLVQRGQVKATFIINAQPRQLGSGSPTQFLPGNQVGMVFHLGYDDAITRLQTQRLTYRGVAKRSVAQRIGHKIDRFSCVLGKDDVARLSADETSDRFPRAFIRVRCFFAQLVGATMDSSIVHLVKPALSVQHGRRLLGCCTAVQVHQAFTVTNGPLQERKVSLDAGYIKSRDGRGGARGHAELPDF